MVRSSTCKPAHRPLVAATLALTVAFLIPTSALATAGQATVSATIPVGMYELTDTQRGHELAVDGFGYLLVPGKPALPARIFAIAIPPGAQVVEVTFDAGAVAARDRRGGPDPVCG